MRIPDLNDPRYLDEVGFFLYDEAQRYGGITHVSYVEERIMSSEILLQQVLDACGRQRDWLVDKTVLTVGCGCTADLSAWPARVKIAADPLLFTYDKLQMLLADDPEGGQTIYLSVGIEDLPLLDDSVDLVVCRNALDRMLDPKAGLETMWNVLRPDGFIYLRVDIGGWPTPDEPNVFTVDEARALVESKFAIASQQELKAHSAGRDLSLEFAAVKTEPSPITLGKKEVLESYERRMASLVEERERRKRGG